MAVNVCPADRVQAPVEVVWELLMHPAGYGGFWDMTVERVEPQGPATVGQRFFAWTLCRRLRIDGEVLEVDAVRHAIRFHRPCRSGWSRTTGSGVRRSTRAVACSATAETSRSRPGGGADCGIAWAGVRTTASRTRSSV